MQSFTQPPRNRQIVQNRLLISKNLFHPASEHRTQLLLVMGLRINDVFLVVPFLRADRLSIGILEIGGALGPEEVRDGITTFFLEAAARRVDAVETRLEALAGEETQGVSDVYNRVSWSGFDPQPRFALLDGAQELQAPLRRKEEGERANVRVLVVSGIIRVVVWRIVKEDERRR